jgi:hypothetical protein
MKKTPEVPTPRQRRREPRRILVVNGTTVWRGPLTSRINRCPDLQMSVRGAEEHFAGVAPLLAEGRAGGNSCHPAREEEETGAWKNGSSL